jgi:hypothetical protein
VWPSTHCDIISVKHETAMSKIRWARTLGLMLVGATGFWLPDVFLQALHAHKFNARDVQIITLVMPLTLLGTFVAAKRANRGKRPGGIGFSMLAGVWLFGGIFMAIGASFSGGGFMSPGGARGAAFVLLLSLFPVYTFIMATYDGSLGALLLVTAVSFLVWIFHVTKLLWRRNREARVQELP